jgi:hypothetical protein
MVISDDGFFPLRSHSREQPDGGLGSGAFGSIGGVLCCCNCAVVTYTNLPVDYSSPSKLQLGHSSYHTKT